MTVDKRCRVSAILSIPQQSRACYVMGHGAGAGMTHPFLEEMATALGERKLATLRYQFPFVEQGSRRPDPPDLAHATIRAVAAEARRQLPQLPLFAGGKSFGGRMTSQAQALRPLDGVQGIAFIGFPLHPSGRPSAERALHLGAITVPMLFLQGARDALADLDLVRGVVDRLGPLATLAIIENADHSFHMPVRSDGKDAAVRQTLASTMVDWINRLVECRSA